MASTSKPELINLQDDNQAEEVIDIDEDLAKLEDLEESVLDYALDNPTPTPTLEERFIQDHIERTKADLELRSLTPGETKQTLISIVNHRRRSEDRFDLDSVVVQALDSMLSSDTIAELARLAKDPLKYQLDDAIWRQPTKDKDTYAKLYIRELRMPVSAFTAYKQTYQETRARDTPWLASIATEMSEAEKATTMYMRYAGYTGYSSVNRHAEDIKANISRYAKFLTGFAAAFRVDTNAVTVRELPLLRQLRKNVAQDLKIAGMLENLLVDVLGPTALNCAVGGLTHELMATSATLALAHDWRLPKFDDIRQSPEVVDCWNNFFVQLQQLPQNFVGPLPSAEVKQGCIRQTTSYRTVKSSLLRLVVGKDITKTALKDGISFYDDVTGRGPDLYKQVLSLVYQVRATRDWCEEHVPYLNVYPCTVRHPRWLHICQLQNMISILRPLIITPHSTEAFQILSNDCLATSQEINRRLDFVEYIQTADQDVPIPTFFQFNLKAYIGNPVVVKYGREEDQVALAIATYHPGNYKYDPILQRSRCQLMILAEKATLVAQVVAIRMLEESHEPINRKVFVYELREHVLAALHDTGISQALEAAVTDTQEIEQFVAQTCLGHLKGERKTEWLDKMKKSREATNQRNPYNRAIGEPNSEERRGLCDIMLMELRSRQERGTVDIGFSIPCPTNIAAGSDEWIQFIMSRGQVIVVRRGKDLDLHATSRFYGKDPLAGIEEPEERGEAMRKRMKHFGRFYNGNLTIDKEAHMQQVVKWIRNLASPEYLQKTRPSARPVIFMCTNCDWAFFDSSSACTGRIHVCPQDIQGFAFKEDEVPGTFNEQSKPSSTLQKSNNIVRTIVWFVHELLCHPRSGQLLLPEQLAGVGLLQVDTNSFLAQHKPLMTITLPQTSIWIASDVAEGSTEYVSYLTTAAVDVILMGRPAHAPGSIAERCEEFPQALFNHRKVIDFGLKRVVSVIQQDLAFVEECRCTNRHCYIRVLELGTKNRLRHECTGGKKRTLKPIENLYTVRKFQELPKAFQVYLWRAHRCPQFQFNRELANVDPMMWGSLDL